MGKSCLLGLLEILIFTVSITSAQNKIVMAPNRNDLNTSCEEFSRFARFNPNSVVGKWWFVFYYWGQPPTSRHFYFRIPTSQQDEKLHKLLDGKVKVPINWSARRLLLTSLQNKTELLVELNDRGIYNFYIVAKDIKKKITPLQLQLKQVANGRYIGLLNCADAFAYAMSAADDVPNRKDVHDAAASIGYRKPGGRSHLYKGHEWMPIRDGDIM